VSRLKTFVFFRKKGGFAVEEVGFEIGARCFDARGWRDWTETVDHHIKFLIRSEVPDIIQLRIEASLNDRLHWCGLQGLG